MPSCWLWPDVRCERRKRRPELRQTEFRALCDDQSLFFIFTVVDHDVVVDETTEGEKALNGENPKPLENWISRVDPKTTAEDFHIPGTLGVFERVE